MGLVLLMLIAGLAVFGLCLLGVGCVLWLCEWREGTPRKNRDSVRFFENGVVCVLPMALILLWLFCLFPPFLFWPFR